MIPGQRLALCVVTVSPGGSLHSIVWMSGGGVGSRRRDLGRVTYPLSRPAGAAGPVGAPPPVRRHLDRRQRLLQGRTRRGRRRPGRHLCAPHHRAQRHPSPTSRSATTAATTSSSSGSASGAGPGRISPTAPTSAAPAPGIRPRRTPPRHGDPRHLDSRSGGPGRQSRLPRPPTPRSGGVDRRPRHTRRLRRRRGPLPPAGDRRRSTERQAEVADKGLGRRRPLVGDEHLTERSGGPAILLGHPAVEGVSGREQRRPSDVLQGQTDVRLVMRRFESSGRHRRAVHSVDGYRAAELDRPSLSSLTSP